MRGTTLLQASVSLLTCLAPFTVQAAPFIAPTNEGGKDVTPAAGPGDNAHTHAPGQLDDLVISEGTWLRAPGEDWFEARAEAGEARFTESDEAAELTEDGEGIGEFESGWVDAEGEYVLRYDEDEDEVAYWRYIDAGTLTRGRQNFVQYCASCHGFDGAGYGDRKSVV